MDLPAGVEFAVGVSLEGDAGRGEGEGMPGAALSLALGDGGLEGDAGFGHAHQPVGGTLLEGECVGATVGELGRADIECYRAGGDAEILVLVLAAGKARSNGGTVQDPATAVGYRPDLQLGGKPLAVLLIGEARAGHQLKMAVGALEGQAVLVGFDECE